MKHDFRTHWGKWLMCALACGGSGVQASASVKSTIVKKAAVAPASVELSQREPYNPTRTRDTMAFWEERARLDPEGAIALRNYADACLKWARESGDGQFVALAEQAARRSLKILPGRFNAQAYSALGHSLLTQHRFQEALVVAESATVYDAQAERLRADILLELGDYDQAARALEKVPHATGDANWNALKARLLEIGGQPEAALKLWLQAAHSSAAQIDGPHESVAWFFFRLGNSLAALGRGDEARQQYRKALQIFPRDYRSLTALARLAACRHDWKSTVTYGEQAAAMVPSLEVLTLLGDAYAALGQTKKARDQARLAEATTVLARARGATDNRQLALFYLDHNRNLPEALRLARADLQSRHDVYTYDTLAWALYKNKQFKEAKNAMHRALLHGTRDSLMCFHAGVIAAANGDKASAGKRLRQALSINPRFHPKAPQQARLLLSTL
jgi:tetratricopeptide (TPR) repeat protein